MRGGVTPGLLFVLGFQYHIAADEHRADWHVAGASRLFGKLERSAQIDFVLSHASMRARRDSNPRSQPSEGCALSSYATGARFQRQRAASGGTPALGMCLNRSSLWSMSVR